MASDIDSGQICGGTVRTCSWAALIRCETVPANLIYQALEASGLDKCLLQLLLVPEEVAIGWKEASKGMRAWDFPPVEEEATL